MTRPITPRRPASPGSAETFEKERYVPRGKVLAAGELRSDTVYRICLPWGGQRRDVRLVLTPKFVSWMKAESGRINLHEGRLGFGGAAPVQRLARPDGQVAYFEQFGRKGPSWLAIDPKLGFSMPEFIAIDLDQHNNRHYFTGGAVPEFASWRPAPAKSPARYTAASWRPETAPLPYVLKYSDRVSIWAPTRSLADVAGFELHDICGRALAEGSQRSAEDRRQESRVGALLEHIVANSDQATSADVAYWLRQARALVLKVRTPVMMSPAREAAEKRVSYKKPEIVGLVMALQESLAELAESKLPIDVYISRVGKHWMSLFELDAQERAQVDSRVYRWSQGAVVATHRRLLVASSSEDLRASHECLQHEYFHLLRILAGWRSRRAFDRRELDAHAERAVFLDPSSQVSRERFPRLGEVFAGSQGKEAFDWLRESNARDYTLYRDATGLEGPTPRTYEDVPRARRARS